MKELLLTRHFTANGAVLGVLSGMGRQLYVLEDEWRNNRPGESCIRTGTYLCTPHGWEANNPVKFKQVWEVRDVPGRSAILIHAGNTHADTRGCLLLGLGMLVTEYTSSVTSSRDAVEYLRREIGQRDFTLKIV